MQTFMRLCRLFFTSIWGWGALMSGALLVGPNIYNVYRVAHGSPPISSGLAWAITQLAGAIAFIAVVARVGIVEHRRAVAAESRADGAETRLADAGAVNRSRNRILAGLADYIGQGNVLCNSPPPLGGIEDMESVETWRREVNDWVDRTREYLLGHSKSAAARFDHTAGIMAASVRNVHYAAQNDVLVLQRRLDNLQTISERGDVFFT